MTVFLEAHFDAATSGTITTANETGISQTTGTAPTFSGADTLYGPAAALTAVAASSVMIQNLPTPATVLHWRAYIKMNGLPMAQVAVIAARDNANGNCASIAVSTTGTIVLRDGTINQATTTYTMTTSSGYVRLEWFVDRGNNTQTLEVFYGANLEGSIANETLTATCSGATSPMYKVSFGTIGASTGAQFAYDEAVLADSRVGPHTPQTYTVTVWDGTSEVPASAVNVWDGTTEAPANLFGIIP